MIVSSGFGHDPGASVDGLLGRVAEWQTRTVQVRVSVRTWGFNSPLAHQTKSGETADMRFAFKTSPQTTTWDDMLAVWKAADDIDLFESGWTFDHFEPIFTDRS